MSKTADFYTDVFVEIMEAEVSWDASFTDGRYELKNQGDICRMSAYAKMRHANMMLLKALGQTEAYEDFKRSILK